MVAAEGMREELENGIRESGLRLTPQRFAILEFLRKSNNHPTAEDIRRAVNREFPRASRATVYNTVASLQSAGLINSVSFEGGVTRYDPNLSPHHHFVCRKCSRVVDVAVTHIDVQADLRSGDKVERFDLTMRGVCAECVAKKDEEPDVAGGTEKRDGPAPIGN